MSTLEKVLSVISVVVILWNALPVVHTRLQAVRYSIWYQPSLIAWESQHEHHRHVAQERLSKWTATSWGTSSQFTTQFFPFSNVTTKPLPTYCVAVITRNGRDTLEYSVVSLLEGLGLPTHSSRNSHQEFFSPRVRFVVHNIAPEILGSGKQQQKKKTGPVLSQLKGSGVPVIDMPFNNHKCAHSRPTGDEQRLALCSWYSKAVLDYASTLRLCHATNADYVVLFEDDVIATTDLLNKLDAGVEEVEHQSSGSQWLFLKLFVSDFFAGWSYSESDILIIVAHGLGCGVIVTWFQVSALSYCQTFFGNKQQQTKWFSWWKHYLAFTTLLIVSMLAIGKQNTPYSLFWVQRGVHEFTAQELSASVLGTVFPRSVINQTVSALEATYTLFPIDINLGKIGDKQQLKTYAIFPSLVEHKGLVSTSAGKSRKSFKHQQKEREKHLRNGFVTSVWFENIWGM